MRLLLAIILALCTPALVHAAYPNCSTCPSHYCYRTCYTDPYPTPHGVCLEYCAIGPRTGFRLAPKDPSTLNLTPTGTQTVGLYSSSATQLEGQYLADLLNQATGWGVEVPSFGIGQFQFGTYSGTIAEIAQQIAAPAGASVHIDEINHMIIFGLPE